MRILMATDGRFPALGAEELLRRLVDPGRAEVRVVYVLDGGDELSGPGRATEVLATAAERFDAAGIACETVTLQGDPATAIGEELSRDRYDLTVIGAGNHAWLGRLVFGSVSTSILQRARDPVLLVHRGRVSDHVRLRVVIGADGSPASMGAIDTLMAVTTPERVDVAVRAVMRTPDLAFAAYPGAAVPVSYVEQATDEARRTAQLALDRSRDRLLRAGYAATGSLGSGWPAADLLDRVEHDGADLLVVGARGIGPFERIAMGSVSAHVVRHAPATLVAPAARASTDTVHVEGPDEDVPLRRYAVRWR